jgi:hypothetical protein
MASTSRNLHKALSERDADAVGPALLEAVVFVPAARDGEGELRPAGGQRDDGSWEVVAFTSQEAATSWRDDVGELLAVAGADLLDHAVQLDAVMLRIDPGTQHGGFLDRDALQALGAQPRHAGAAPLEAPGDWASEDLAAAVREAVAGQPLIEGAWLAERGGRKTVVLDLTSRGDGDSDVAIEAIVDAVRPVLPQGTLLDFLLLDESRRAEAQALGDPLS